MGNRKIILSTSYAIKKPASTYLLDHRNASTSILHASIENVKLQFMFAAHPLTKERN